MDDGVIAAELLFTRRPDGRPEAVGTGPIRRAIHRSAVAKDNRRAVAIAGILELALNEEDRALRGPAGIGGARPWESSTEHNARRLRQDLHVRAELVPDELENGGLAGPGPPVSTIRRG
jgi:hypothetical protein